MKILVINGPNLNFLGKREPEIYGGDSLEDLNSRLKSFVEEYSKDVTVEFFQSNSEGDIVSCIQSAYGDYDGILINPAAYTHTSIAIRDAILATDLPVVEVHISNIFKREGFRQRSFVSDVSVGVISGFGINSYFLGIRGLIDKLLEDQK